MPGSEPATTNPPVKRPSWLPPRTARARPNGVPVNLDRPRAQTVTVTVQVTMTGEDALADAVELAERLRPLVATVETAPVVEAVPVGSAPLRIHPGRHVAELNGVPLTLTRREYGLLLFLADHPGRVYTRPQLLRAVWEQDLVSGVRTVDVHVRRIRAKLGEVGPVIGTVHGVGYRLDAADRVTVVRDVI
jgi:two-component system OmpR family response regulator